MRVWLGLVRIVLTLLSVVLVVRFLLRIFEPGHGDTARFFEMAAPALMVLDMGLAAVTWPVRLLADMLVLPFPALQAFLPQTPVAPLADRFIDFLYTAVPGFADLPFGKDILMMDVSAVFPGVLDWPLILAIVFWGLAQSVLEGAVDNLERKNTKARREARDELIREEYTLIDRQKRPGK